MTLVGLLRAVMLARLLVPHPVVVRVTVGAGKTLTVILAVAVQAAELVSFTR